jgi:group II intron reverse transcriptase/maturase
MQSATTVLDVLRERGRRGLPLDQLYRQLFNPQLYLLAYGRIYPNKGAMTPGADAETADGMTLGKIERIIDALRHERYRFLPVRRLYIPKKDGKQRPLGLPSWSDKLLGEVVRLLLEAYYEPQFSEHSHGYRPGRGCRTALREVAINWTGTTWFIEGDISRCFDELDHSVMLETLGEKVQDSRLLRLIGQMLRAGYLEDWVWGATLSGAPQGGVLSPCLSNVYLDRLDKFVDTVLIPGYTRGEFRSPNPDHRRVTDAIAYARRRGDHAAVRALRKQQRSLPSKDPVDPRYRRLRYVRYADDILLGYAGPKAEAEEIKRRLGQFLRDDLKLELSETKTLITHARSGAARFLGYEITVRHDDRKLTAGRRAVNGGIQLRVPKDVIKAKCSRYTARGKPVRRPALMNEEDRAIISRYGAEYRGIVQYYLLAGDVWRLSRLHWVMETSLLKTLASKYDSSVSKMARKYRAIIQTPHGPRKCLQVTVDRGEDRKPLAATFGGIPLIRQKNAVPSRSPPGPGSWSAASWRGGASSAGKRRRCTFTRSGSSPT